MSVRPPHNPGLGPEASELGQLDVCSHFIFADLDKRVSAVSPGERELGMLQFFFLLFSLRFVMWLLSEGSICADEKRDVEVRDTWSHREKVNGLSCVGDFRTNRII